MEETTNKQLSDVSNENHCLVGLTPFDKIQKEWKSMEESLSSLRSQVTAVQHQLRALEKTTKKEMRILEKDVLKSKNKGNRKPSGFAKPSKISSELCEFMGKENGAEVARTEVTQFVIAYIKQNKLAESKNIITDKTNGKPTPPFLIIAPKEAPIKKRNNDEKISEYLLFNSIIWRFILF